MIFTQKFTEDFDILKNNVKEHKKFAFSKYADGEYNILINQPIRNIDNWFYNPNENYDFYKLLFESFMFQDEGYYIGISCPCCDVSTHRWYMDNKGSSLDNTTFANIFVNNNYEMFKQELLPLFNTYKRIFLIANENSNLLKLKEVLNITDFYGIGIEGFKTNLNLIDELITKINYENITDTLFLFCAGPLGNVLSHKLWNNNKNNTYIDIGSTLNIWTEKNLRDYQLGGVYSNKLCIF
jgi:hypothetical protein